MNFDRINLFIMAAFLVSGSVIGGALTYNQMDHRIDQLEDQVQDQPTVRIVNVNGSSDEVLTSLFERVDESVVSVRAYGTENSQGSGFIYSKKGYIVTNEHVVEGANSVEVTFNEGETVKAKIIGKDLYTDLAVLKVKKNGLKPLELGNLSKVKVGERAVAIGNPFGLPGTMTSGIISQKGRLLPVQGGFSIPNAIQTDAAINPGNSGGPLMNEEGEVVGVNTAIETNTGTFSGVGFAIPVSTVERVVPELIQEGDVDHPWIGVSGRDVDAEIADRMDLENATGFLVVNVVKGSPADKAGLKAGNKTARIKGVNINLGGDVIVAMEGEKVRGINDILLKLAKDTEVGETIDLTVIRNGERKNIELTLSARPKD